MKILSIIASILMLSAAASWGQSLVFDGSKYASGDNAPTITTALTLAGWIKADSSQSGSYPRLFGNEGKWILYIQVGSDKLAWYGSGTDAPFPDSPDLTDDTWHHVAVTYDGVNLSGYVDGVSAGQIAKTNALNSGGTIDIGNRSDLARGFSGSIADPVRIYSYALTANEVAKLYQKKAEVLNWDGSRDFSTAVDKSGNGYDGTASAESILSTEIGSATFDDANLEYININYDQISLGWTDISVSMWVTPSETLVSATDGLFGAWDEYPNGKTALVIIPFTLSGTNVFRMYYGNLNVDYIDTIGKVEVIPDTTYHVVATWRDSDYYNSLYVDGVLMGDVTDNTGSMCNEDMLIGNFSRGGVPRANNYFTGKIDDVQIFRGTLTTNQVAAFSAGTQPTNEVLLKYPMTPALSAGMKVRPEEPLDWVADTTTAIDGSGNGYDGTCSTNTILSTEVGVGTFTEISDRITVSDADALSFNGTTSDNPFTFVARCRYNVPVAAAVRATICSKLGASPDNNWEYIFAFGTDGKLQLTLYTGNTGYIQQKADAGLTADQYYEIVATYDGSRTASGIKLFVDGNAIATTSSGVGFSSMKNLTNDFLVGQTAYLPANRLIDIDYFAAYRSELTTNQVAALSAGTQPTNEVLLKYPMVAKKDTALTSIPLAPSPLLPYGAAIPDVWDSSGEGNHGSLEPDRATGPTWSGSVTDTNGVTRYGIYDFDTTNKIELPEDDLATVTSNLTFAYWLYSKGAQGGFTHAFLKAPSNLGATGGAGFWTEGNDMHFFINYAYNTPERITETLTHNEWHHYCGTYDASLSTNNLALYRDGILIGQHTYSAAIAWVSTGFNIGNRENDLARGTNIKVDDCYVWPSTLTSNQVFALATQETAPTNQSIIDMDFDDKPYEWQTYDGQHTITAYPEGTAGPIIGE
jgi:hypothetical protein